MALKVVWTSDLHFELKTDEVDRNPEILRITLDVVDKAVEFKKENHQVILVLGGDIFNNNSPSEKTISSFFTVLNKIKQNELDTYIIVGNHESVADPVRLSCLSFIKKAKVGYPTIKLIDDIASLKITTNDCGDLHFTFLPHITKAVLESNHRKMRFLEITDTQTYIETKCRAIVKRIGIGQHYVFSHLNVRGAHPGSEENLLRKSEAYLPKCFVTEIEGVNLPTIIQGHLHTRAKIGNINIIGNPLYCGFGETSEKYYAVIHINGQISKPDTIEYIKSKCVPFLQLDINLIEATKDFFEIDEVKQFWEIATQFSDDTPMVKFNITTNPENNSYDWEAIRGKWSRLLKCNVKPIIPRVISKKIVRSENQKINLDPKDSVKIYLKANLKNDNERANRIYEKTLKYLGE